MRPRGIHSSDATGQTCVRSCDLIPVNRRGSTGPKILDNRWPNAARKFPLKSRRTAEAFNTAYNLYYVK